MLYKSISIAFVLSVFSTIVLLSINRPNSSTFLPSMILQTLAFVAMGVFMFLLNKITSTSDLVNYVCSFILAYFILLLVVWKINGNSFSEFIIKYHQGKDFWSMVIPFIISNLIMIIWQAIRK